jgi:hypothetical protein
MTIAKIRYGAGLPDNSVGFDGDFYLDTIAGDLYQRVAGVYTVAALGGSSVGSDLYLFNNY